MSIPKSDRFLVFMPFIFEWEGEAYENDPDDPGGATKYGIDQRSHPDIKIHELTKADALDIYWQEWLTDGCEPMPSPYAEVFFNCAVNMGLGHARSFDRQVPGADAKALLDLQDDSYRSLTEHNLHLRKFLKGWLNRTHALRERFLLT